MEETVDVLEIIEDTENMDVTDKQVVASRGGDRLTRQRLQSKRRAVITANPVRKKIKMSGEKWTTDECIRLYNAVCKYGIENEEKIAQCVRTRCVTDVISKMRHFKTLSYAKLKRETFPEDGFLNHDKIIKLDALMQKVRHLEKTPRPGTVVPVGFALKMLEKFGKYPAPKNCFGIDFRQVYGFLYDCYCGNPTRQMDTPTTAFMLRIYKELEECYKDHEIFDISFPIDNAFKTYSKRRVVKEEVGEKYGSIFKRSQGEVLFDLMTEDENVNPLNVPYSPDTS